MLQPAAIDGLAFAQGAEVLEGELGLESLPRLSQAGSSGAVLDFVLRGEINERGKPELGLVVDGSVRLECQRCLGRLDLPLHLEARLELAASEAEIAAADDDVERVLISREMRVAALVEDEVLLALPMVPKHERCKVAADLAGDAPASAFQVLAGLKKLNR
jgi:uncharacterized protein